MCVYIYFYSEACRIVAPLPGMESAPLHWTVKF